MNDCPCWNDGKGCGKRTTHPVNCHSTCKEYKKWVAKKEKEKNANAPQSEYLGYYYNVLIKSRKKGNHK